ncbi:phosphotransferase family protein [Deinococcus multiflagellatus]|uniref:phosphotransferase family protein n=1 Tax=Deinococcus multiflagellatus TaxID=1656887 RepID=UPI001CCA6C1B|nr:aminoglycoside phosphotransferase family protein [Deinococcus multiflagellatus]MBZ9712619.1 aminoglycoside phosphotransferase family protein [Deinococcus multiflagellatus]
MAALPDLSAAEQQAFIQKYGLQGPLRRLPSAGIVNRVYQTVWRGQPAVLRVPLPGDDEDTLTESVAAPAAFRAGIRTPELLRFDEDRDIVAAPVTLYALAPGRSLDTLGWRPGDPRLRRAWQEAGRELARLHAAVRTVPDPLGRLEAIHPPDVARVQAQVTETARLGTDDAEWAAALTARLLADHPPLARPVFLHNDLHPGNLMVTGGGALTALIDWGDAGWGDPVLDLTYGGPLAAPDLRRGYDDEAPGVLDSGAPLRLLAYLLHDALRRLARSPKAQGADLWHSRPGTSLLQLLRVSSQVPEWAAVLSG